VYKSQFFPRRSFIDPKIGHKPSYAWKSIMEAKIVLKKDLQWRIGDCSKVKIWLVDTPPCLFGIAEQDVVHNLSHE
jgi:hypothetical protein